MDVFLVDDSAVMRDRLSALLSETAGLRIEGYATGAREALVSINRRKPDVVILDIQLAEGTGLDVLGELQSGGCPTPRTVVFTNYPYPQYRRRCLELGAHFFLDKARGSEALSWILGGGIPGPRDK